MDGLLIKHFETTKFNRDGLDNIMILELNSNF